jgi:hypothetical protein
MTAVPPRRRGETRAGWRAPGERRPPADGRDTPPRHPLLSLQASAGNRATTAAIRGGETRERPVVQRFGSEEHRSLGDEATGGASYDVGSRAPGVAGFPGSLALSHGDLVALSGDYFDPRDTLRKDGAEIPNPDSLFRLAAMPSSDPGQVAGTRDEVLYALYLINAGDARFAPGGTWEAVRTNAAAKGSPVDAALVTSGRRAPFSAAVMAAVDKRYKALAARNREHFVSPTGAQGSASDPGGSSALGTYRSLHEDALRRAFEAGQHGAPLDMALAREAAAQHFLTDSFAAGHVRTPRAAIQDHWQAVYPLFWANLRKKIAHDVAVYMNDEQWNLGTIVGTVSVMYDKVYAKVLEKTAAMPPVGFGDLVSLVAHDLDNELGLAVVNDFGDTWLDFGDSNLDHPALENRTREMAQSAVAAGVADVRHAHQLGQVAPGFLDDTSIFAGVRTRPGGSAVEPGKFEPEKFSPRPDPDQPVTQTWAAASIDELWTMPVRSDVPEETYGKLITEAVTGGEIHEIFEGMASEFPTEEPVAEAVAGVPVVRSAVGLLDAQAGFREGFLKPLTTDPQTALRAVVDFNPSLGQAGFNEDDAAREDVENMPDEELRGLTLNSRADRIRSLIVGATNYVDDDDGDLVIRLFETAASADRPQLYRLVEGHAWQGEFVHGVFVSDDELWNALSIDRLRRLRGIINGG